ncbi:MAG: DUF4190 domain-containing protein [Hamadaea sp.]|uniref:DUF4190 domain-containing protein n=1 Tax=Hamadaea sp. TaxID=2024425 RepID=UPI00182185EE|nr:DUF4190 domain-containing protein [Hamadaea sp.]NUR73885.1 DUF4190 domain-containing protein [Hamadaea sp.]NUT20629.1 DUF4190 domain-containing protein [Hamadaea sp.]
MTAPEPPPALPYAPAASSPPPTPFTPPSQEVALPGSRIAEVARTSTDALRRTTAKHNVLAIVALLTVALSVLTFGILAPVGAILGHLSLRQLKGREQTGRGMARAAVILGWTFTFFLPCLTLLFGMGTILALIKAGADVIGLFAG